MSEITSIDAIHDSKKDFEAIYMNVDKNGRYIEFKEYASSRVEFALKYGLNHICITNCLKGRQKDHKGWVFRHVDGYLN